jgi:hypothetical protein
MIIRRYILFFLFITGLSGQSFQGYTIFSPAAGGPGGGANGISYLINNQLNVINVWNHSRGPSKYGLSAARQYNYLSISGTEPHHD